jgi:hypothetical protein
VNADDLRHFILAIEAEARAGEAEGGVRLDVERLALAVDTTGILLNWNAIVRIAAEYAALAFPEPDEEAR